MAGKDVGLVAKLKVSIDKTKLPDSIAVNGAELSGLNVLIDEIMNWYNGFNTTGLMAVIGETIDYIVQENFEKNGRPSRWAEWSTAWSKRRKEKPYGNSGTQILQLRGDMRDSLNVSKITKDSVTYGTNLEYAARQNYGGNGIPARPFMVIPESEYHFFAEAIMDYFK
jgi:phage gpG-like protein